MTLLFVSQNYFNSWILPHCTDTHTHTHPDETLEWFFFFAERLFCLAKLRLGSSVSECQSQREEAVGSNVMLESTCYLESRHVRGLDTCQSQMGHTGQIMGEKCRASPQTRNSDLGCLSFQGLCFFGVIYSSTRCVFHHVSVVNVVKSPDSCTVWHFCTETRFVQWIAVDLSSLMFGLTQSLAAAGFFV